VGATRQTWHMFMFCSERPFGDCGDVDGDRRCADRNFSYLAEPSDPWADRDRLRRPFDGSQFSLVWSYASVALGMMVSGAGTGLLNGETPKAMIGAVPPERAGMAGGLTGTTRFVGIVAGIAVLGAVLAAGTEHHVRDGLEALGAHWSTDDVHAFALRAVAGHGSIANTRGPATDALAALCRASFAGGFVWLLLVAGVVALMAAGLSYAFVRADETTADLPLNRSTRLISSAGVGRP